MHIVLTERDIAQRDCEKRERYTTQDAVLILIIIIIHTHILPPDVHKRCQISGRVPCREDPALLSNRFGALMIFFPAQSLKNYRCYMI